MKKGIIFILIGAILFRGLSWIIDEGARHSDYEQVGKINAVMDHSLDPQVMIFGSSAGENGIDPQIIQQHTGLSTYNFSLTGSRFQQFEGLVREFMTYSKNSRVVLFAETYGSFEHKSSIMAPDYFMPQISRPTVYDYLYRTNPALIWKCRFVPLYKYTVVNSLYYRNSIRGWKNIFSGQKQGDPSAGYFPVDKKWDLAADKLICELPPFTIELNEEMLARYAQTLRELKAGGKKVIIVLMPMYGELFNTKADINPLRKKLQQISRETGTVFLDFSDHEICKKKDIFFNSNHLNKTGSIIFSRILADSIKPVLQEKN